MRKTVTVEGFEFDLQESRETQIIEFMKNKEWICAQMLVLAKKWSTSTADYVLKGLARNGQILDKGLKTVKLPSGRSHQVHVYAKKK